ncbi:mitochondrial fission process protein 1 [Leptopilina boulardi]|uniref:mitochondrial fission process protein 1 n=1 Tax=Leptopilina boulardi TaxID=63433 RepID=UPI0021F6826C|nr:mitochondrial fission process protein 1 [Leptopilina boulardi]
MDNKEREVDLYRDTPLRYLGYTNEVGEAFRNTVPKKVVWFSYLVASGYVIADTFHKASKVYKMDTTLDKNKNLLLSATDTLLWQGLASIIIPGFTINRICAGVRFLQMRNILNLKGPWISTAIGLASIPLIIRPIDLSVENMMDSTYRKWTGYYPHYGESIQREKD